MTAERPRSNSATPSPHPSNSPRREAARAAASAAGSACGALHCVTRVALVVSVVLAFAGMARTASAITADELAKIGPQILKVYEGAGFAIEREVDFKLLTGDQCRRADGRWPNGCTIGSQRPAPVWVNPELSVQRVPSVLLHEFTHIWLHEQRIADKRRKPIFSAEQLACDFVSHVLYCQHALLPPDRRQGRICSPPWSVGRRPNFGSLARWYRGLPPPPSKRLERLREVLRRMHRRRDLLPPRRR